MKRSFLRLPVGYIEVVCVKDVVERSSGGKLVASSGLPAHPHPRCGPTEAVYRARWRRHHHKGSLAYLLTGPSFVLLQLSCRRQ